MSDASPIESRSDLEGLFAELGEELDRLGTTAAIQVVGGSWLLWHSHRSATWDVDAVERLDPTVRDAARRVATRRAIDEDWLNDRAAAFRPAGADTDGSVVAFEHGGLVVKMPPARVVFLMKLYRASPQDHEDMVLLWPIAGFEHPDHAAAAFRQAYPHAPEDEFLAAYIADIAHQAGDVDPPPSPSRPQGAEGTSRSARRRTAS